MNHVHKTILLVGFLGGCAIGDRQVASGLLASSQPKPANSASPPITESTILPLQMMRNGAAKNFTDSYVRIVAKSPAVPSLTLGSTEPSVLKATGLKLARYFWNDKSTVLVVAQPINLPSGTLPKQQLLSASRATSPETVNFSNVILSPYFEPTKDVKILVEYTKSNSVETRVFQSAVDALSVAASFASGGVLAPFVALAQSNQAKKADEAVEAVFRQSAAQTLTVDFDPYTIERIDLVVVQNSEHKAILTSINYEEIESLITSKSSGKASEIPTDPIDITRTKLSFGTPEVTIRKAIEQDATLAGNFAKDERESLQSFCQFLPAKLGDLGLKKFDRLAVIYAYLRDSSWNTQLSYRVSNDRCQKLVENLETQIPHLKLNTASELVRGEESKRTALIKRYSGGLWTQLPAAFQRNTKDDWLKVLAENVRISATGTSIVIKDDIRVEVGEGTSYSNSDVAETLAGSLLSYKKNVMSCFTLSPESTGQYFRSSCFTLQVDGKTVPIDIEFSAVESSSRSPPNTYVIDSIRFLLKEQTNVASR